MSSVEEKPPSDPHTKLREMRNTDLVSRLLAATPPYLYSALPLQPHAFFFSEMLRSFVNARHGCRPPQFQRRFKRRSHKYFAENENEWRRDYTKEEEKKEPEVRPEVPLELTVDKHPREREHSPRRLSPKAEPAKPSSSPDQGRQSTFVDVGTEELPKPLPCTRNVTENAVPASNLILPPPPPMWYPPLYNPQFGVDPLNFFIDLRVSGHIYDRKRALAEGIESSINQDGRTEESAMENRLIGRDFARPRHLSAFSVPVRGGNINVDGPDKYFDHGPKTGTVNGTSYVMKNLKRVYERLHSDEDCKAKRDKSDDTKAEASDVDEDIID